MKNSLKISEKTYIPLWPLVTFLLIFFNKLIFFINNHEIISTFGYIHKNILVYLIIEDGSLLFIISALSLFSRGRFKNFIIIALISINLFYLIDSIVLQSLYDRFTILAFLRYVKEIKIISTFLTPGKIISLLILIFTSFFIRKKAISVALKRSYLTVIFVVFASVPWIVFYNRPFDPLVDLGSMNFLRLNQYTFINRNFDAEVVSKIKTLFPSVYEGFSKLSSGEDLYECQSRPKRNVIILISESLSQVDSHRSGGLFDRIPLIDLIQKDGITLTNAISNGYATEDALAALLLGVDPLQTEVFQLDMPTRFPAHVLNNRNIVLNARSHGYKTFFITNSPLDFLNTDVWLRDVGFDYILDSRSSFFERYQRFTFNSPGDDALYSQALSFIYGKNKERTPFLLCLATVSLHKPYMLPDKQYQIGNHPLLNLLNYVDHSTFDFYQSLREFGFFNNGVLLIIGDHRRMDPLEPEEMQNRGLDSFGRIVGSFIGTGIDKGKIDHTLLNHTDINTILNLLVRGCNINFNNLALYNKNMSLGIDEPFATNVVTDYLGLVLIRTDTKQPLLIKLHRNVNIDKIEGPVYKQIIAYTLLDSAWLNERQHYSK